MTLIFLGFFYLFFFLFLYYVLTLKIRVGVFSGIVKARMLNFGIHIDTVLLYCGIENRIPCLSSSLMFHI